MTRIFILATLLIATVGNGLVFADDNSVNSPAQEELVVAQEYGNFGLIVPEDVRLRFEQLDRQPSPILLNPMENFDWRDMGGVTPVKNQGGCGSCWDFAATGAFESAIYVMNGTIWDLSEQAAMDCNAEHYGCGGGWMSSVYNLFRDYGAIEEDCYPYFAQDGFPCRQDTCVRIAMLDDYVDVQNDVNAIKNALLTSPLSTTLSIPEGFDWNCFDGQWLNADHAVVIVGWDDSMCDHGGWIVKNSWGAGWGDGGFFYIPYNSCGIGHYTQLPLFTGGLPHIALNQDYLEINVPSDGQNNDSIYLTNTGFQNLFFQVRLKNLQDSFGYHMLESGNSLGPEYNWVDITEIGEPIDFPGYPGYSNSGPLDFGFEFNYYGNTYSSINVCSEGWASFTDSENRTSRNAPIPSVGAPNNLLAAFWENLDPVEGDVFFYSNQADTAIISWVNVPDIMHQGEFTFQILLLGENTIVYQYESMGPDGPLDDASIGIENADGTIGLEVCCNKIFTYGQKAVRFELGQPSGNFDWLRAEDEGGIIGPGDSFEFGVNCVAGDHPDGSYWAQLNVFTNDIENKKLQIPVVMNVGATSVDRGENLPKTISSVNCYPNPFNGQTNIEFGLTTDSHAELHIIDLLGREVATLGQGNFDAGTHSVVWDAGDNASGIYFFVIRTETTSEIRKLMLLK